MSLKIFFGPYESNGLVRYKTERLHGLMSKLSELGFHIELIPTNHLERLTIEMRNREIFRCNIKFLKYNMDFEDDEIAMRAVNAVREAHSRIYNESNIPRYFVNKWGMKGVQAVKKGLSPNDIFSHSVQLICEIPNKKDVRMLPKK
ncbi:hypothetical protein HHI36_005747 [Cryptolaemus montrouzieri]|uniref:Uncharacterized protein n=1 Tax=Cryptolaemus montrouzieri TaxID=559131 RepID=A0ABD2NV86_9CUCU